MPPISIWQRRDHAAEQGYGVPALNHSSLEQGLAIMDAARACDALAILNFRRSYREGVLDPRVAAA